MKIGDVVKIKPTNTMWDNKTGKVESLDEEKNTATVFVDFIPEEGKRIRQDFSMNLLEVMNESIHEDLNEEDEDDREIDLANDELQYINNVRTDLADYFGVELEDVEHTHGNYYIVENKEYWVGSQHEAYEDAKACAREILDDLGLEALTDDFREYVVTHCIDEDMLEDAINESNEFYINDIEDEQDSEYGSRLIAEMVDANIVTEGDFVDDEIPENVYEERKEQFLEYLNKNVDKESFVKEMFDSKTLEENGYIDFDEVAELCVEEDGIAHYLSSYDGNEVEIRDGLFAYRVE